MAAYPRRPWARFLTGGHPPAAPPTRYTPIARAIDGNACPIGGNPAAGRRPARSAPAPLDRVFVNYLSVHGQGSSSNALAADRADPAHGSKQQEGCLYLSGRTARGDCPREKHGLSEQGGRIRSTSCGRRRMSRSVSPASRPNAMATDWVSGTALKLANLRDYVRMRSGSWDRIRCRTAGDRHSGLAGSLDGAPV